MRCVLLSGSPRGKKATSYAILEYLQSKLVSNDDECHLILLSKANRDQDELRAMLEKMENADYVVLAAPLYVDTLPSHVLQVLMDIADARTRGEIKKYPRFIGIVNSGFPEAEQNLLALEILKVFCNRASFNWAGGLPFGGGAMVGRTSLEKAGGRVRFARESMNILANAISSGRNVPEEAVEKIKKKPIPAILYIKFAQMGWKQRAKKNGVVKALSAQPYVNSELQ